MISVSGVICNVLTYETERDMNLVYSNLHYSALHKCAKYRSKLFMHTWCRLV